MENARIPTSEQLMAEMAWVRQLARALLRDPAVADDVAQDAWLVANEKQPDADRPLRPWLGRVVRNLIRTRRRADARRTERDEAYEEPATVATPQELVERVELQRAVADEVLALAEPYRSTVLLHFVEGLSSADIARQQRIPDGTVRRRLKVALDQLREALEKRTNPPKRGWLAALIPLARLPGPAATAAATTVGVLVMKKIVVSVIVLVLLLLGGAAIWRSRTHRDGGASTENHEGATRTKSSKVLAVPAVVPSWAIAAGSHSRRIAGHVLADGVAVQGARVVLGIEGSSEPGSTFMLVEAHTPGLLAIAEATTSTDGAFDFGEQPGAAFILSASAPNRTPATLVVASADPRAEHQHLILRLETCDRHIAGTISDASGGVIAHAHVAVAGLSGGDTDASGAYSVCLPSHASFGTPNAQVRITADGYSTLVQTVIAVGDLHLDFTLVPEAVLVGRVVLEDGSPVAGAHVMATPAMSELARQVASGWATSDADGAFQIGALAPASYIVNASSPDLGATPPVPTVLQATKTTRPLRLVFARSAHVRGVIADELGPVSGAFVIALRGGEAVGNATSQTDGTFEIVGVPYGPVRLSSPVYATPPVEKQIDRPVVEGIHLVASKPTNIHGHITRNGKPVAEAHAMYEPPPMMTFYGQSLQAVSDANGAFSIEGLPAGAARIVAWDSAGKAFSRWIPIELESGEQAAVDLELELSGEVRGHIVDENTAPVANAYIRLDLVNEPGNDDMCEAMTDAHGAFDCSMLMGGTYAPSVTPSPGARTPFSPASGERFPTIKVPSSGVVDGITLAVKNERVAIRGIVVDDTGAAATDVHVTAAGFGISSMDFPSTMTNSNGRFAITNLAPGTYTITAHAADGSETDVVDVVAGGTDTRVTLPRAGSIAGTLVGFTPDRPIVLLTQTTRDTTHNLPVVVDGASFFTVGLSPGRYTIEARMGASVDGQTVEVQPGKTAQVTLRSRGFGTVEGSVSELGSHAPVAGMRCDANVSNDGAMTPMPPDPSLQAFTDATGHFSVRAPIGRVRIVCNLPGPMSAAGGDVDVTAGSPAHFDGVSVRAADGPPSDAGMIMNWLLVPLTVQHVLPNGPAANAGIQDGDHVVSIDGTSLQGMLSPGADQLLMNHKPGTVATIVIERGGTQQTVKLTLGGRPPR